LVTKEKNRIKLIRSLILLVVIMCSGRAGHSQYIVGDINFEGNTRTKSSYLQRFIQSETGEVPDSQKIADDLRKLRYLAPVMDAEAFLVTSDSCQSLTYAINERYTLLPVGDFGITRNNFWIGGGLMESNLAGKGMYAYGYYQYNLRHTLHLIFRNPYIFASSWGIELQLRNLPSVENYNNSTQILNRYLDLSLAVRYEFRFENEIALGTSFRRLAAENINFTGSTEEALIDIERSAQVFFFRHEIRKLTCRNFYIKGWKNLVNLSFQMPYNSTHKPVTTFYDKLKFFARTGQRGNVALRIMAGISTEKEKAFYPFLADSYYSFRGIGYHVFRGNAMALINAEYRYTCFENHFAGIQLVTFSDAGFISQLSENAANSPNIEAVQLFLGPGLRIIYKKVYNAILTIDYGFDLLHRDKGGLVVGWGQYF